MAFLIKKVGASVRLIRRKTASIAVDGVGRAFKHTDTYIGSLALHSTELPAGFPRGHAALTAAETESLERKVFEPARVHLAAVAAAEAARQADPNWRAREAIALLEQISSLVAFTPLHHDVAQRLSLVAATLLPRGEGLGAVEQSDPLTDLLAAVRATADAVRAGCYGVRQEGAPANSKVAALWKELREAFGESGTSESLMSALQDARWVLRRNSAEGPAKAG